MISIQLIVPTLVLIFIVTLIWLLKSIADYCNNTLEQRWRAVVGILLAPCIMLSIILCLYWT